MVDIGEMVASLGGFAQKKQLIRAGARDRDLTQAVRTGDVIRVRNGWYSTLSATDAGVRALRVGGRLTGLSAIVELGGWVLSAPPLHVAVPGNASRLRRPDDKRRRLNTEHPGNVTIHWEPRENFDRGTVTCVALTDALYRVLLDERLEDSVAALDWALHVGLIDDGDLDAVIARLPVNLRWIAHWVDATCESLPESLSRTRFRLRGHDVRSQVKLPSRERIDLVIDETAGLEVDGRAHHAESFLPDRAKDLRITIAGYHAIRPSASMIFTAWDEVYLAVSTALLKRGKSAPLPVGNSGKGSFGPASRSVYARRRRKPRRSSPEFST